MLARCILLTAILLITATSAAAGDSYLIIVENVTDNVRGSLNGFPGRSWGKTVDKIYLYGGTTQTEWLDNHGIKYKAAIFNEEPSNLYICYMNTDNFSIDNSQIFDITDDYVLSISRIQGAESYRRLTLRNLPFTSRGQLITETMDYNSYIDSLISGVSQDTIIDYLSRLSGETPVEVGGEIDTIHTRYSGTYGNELAAAFIKETLEGYGYETEYHGFFSGRLRHTAVYDENLAWTVNEDSEAFRTTNGGATWEELDINVLTSLWGISNVGSDSVWVTGNDGTIKFSSDGGEQFVSQSSNTYVFLFGSCFINPNEGWVAGDNGVIIHTSNAGQNWTVQSTPTGQRLYDIYFVDDEYGWAVGRNGVVLHTSDGGANWVNQTSNTSERIYCVNFTDRDNGWLVGWSGVVRHTTDGGSNWQTVNLGSYIEKYHVDFADAQHGCIVGWNGEIFNTTDGGSNWIQAESGTSKDFYGVEFADNMTGYAVGNSVLKKTTDGGITWLNQTSNIEGVSRNVIATKTGTTDPDQQVIICAHMDDTSEQPQVRAPGADDNGSGTIAVIEAARLFVESQFEKTIKFCLWTGEEQGLLGSEAYAGDAYGNGDDIVGVFNFDMIGWDGNDDYLGELHCGTMSSSQELGYLFEDVITDYEISIVPVLLTWGSTDRSDHASFWDYDYPAMLGIEDFTDDFNPYYHTTDDNLSIIDVDFFTEYTKAAVGAVATMAIPDTGQVGIETIDNLPSGFVLGQNYPNPFNAATVISLTVPAASEISLEVYNILGEKTAVLFDGEINAGVHNFIWNAKNTASGVYFYRLATNNKSAVGRMVLIK